MQRNKIILIISAVAFVTVAGSFLKFLTYQIMQDKQYEKGKYGKYCYLRQDADHRIRYPVYYSNLDECGKPLK